jgi:alpha-N-arabinofuranosidase
MDQFIKLTSDICDEIKAKKNSDKTVNLSFDEWNVWFRTRDEEKRIERWQIAPHLLEEKYDFLDALLVGCMLVTLQNNADRVKIACLAQLVNVIAPIMTDNGGKAWAQTIFYPFMYASAYGRGKTLKATIDCDTYKSSEGWDVPYLCTSVINNEEKRELVVFAVNRSMNEDMELSFDLDDTYKLAEHIEFYTDDLYAENDKDAQRVLPSSCPVSDTKNVTVKKHSWNMLVFKY